MKKEITRISVFQTSKVLAVLYALFGFIYTLIGTVMLTFAGQETRVMAIFYILMPIILGMAGFVFVAIGAWAYNLVAKWVGGIEVDVSDSEG